MVRIDNELLDEIIRQARAGERNRKHFNFHKSYGEPVQRLLNAIEPGSYIRPHMHKDPDKTEVFLVLRGSFLVTTFTDDGTVDEFYLLSSEAGQYGVEIEPGTYHTIAAIEPGSVAYEIKNGPFDAAVDKKFAPWAPEEGTREGRDYLERLLKDFAGGRK